MTMRKFLKKLLSLLTNFREAVFKAFFRVRFRYDIFISYTHRDDREDARKYASNLKKQLSGLDFTCFIDEEESPPGVSLTRTVETALRKSAVVVLLGTRRALTRPYVTLEIEKFARTERAIIPINIGEALTKDPDKILAKPPWNVIKDRELIWIDETEEAFNKDTPSPQVADGIDKLFKYTRRNVRVRTEIILTAVIVLIAALGAGYVIKGKTEELAAQSSRNDELKRESVKLEGDAKRASDRAEEQTQLANQATIRANEQLERARQAEVQAKRQEEIAHRASQEASRQQAIASEAAAEARKQQQIARDAKLEAEKQKTIARARQLANQAERAKGESSDELFNSTSMAISSLNLQPTLEGDLVLRNNLNLLPSLSEEMTYKGALSDAAVSPNATAMAFLAPNSEIEIKRAGQEVAHRKRPALHHLVALSNDGQYVATAGGNTARVQNMDTGETWDVTIFEGSNIKALALSPGAKYLALVASEDEGLWVEVWEKESKKFIGTPMRGDVEFMQLTSVAFSPDKEELFAVGGQEKKSGSINGFLRTWLIVAEQSGTSSQCLKEGCKDAPKYRFDPRSSLRQPSSVEIIALSSGDNYLLAANTSTALVWKRTRLDDYQQVARLHLDHPLALAFDRDSSHVHVVSEPAGWIEGAPAETDKTVKIWESSGRREKTRVMFRDEIMAVSFRPDDDLVTTISQTYGDEENGVRVWEAKDGAEKKQESLHFTPEGPYDFSGDGGYLAGVDEHGAVQIWDLIKKTNPGRGLATSRLKVIKAIRLSYDGKFMAVVGSGQTSDVMLIVYQRFDGGYKELASSLQLPQDTALDALGLSPDGNLVATATPNYQVRIWNIKTGRETTAQPLQHVGEVRALLFSPQGGLIAAQSIGGKTMVWKVGTGKLVASLGGYSWASTIDATHDIAFSHDERYFAVGSFDGTARVWEVATGQEVILLQHEDPVVSVAFSRDGKYLATATKAIDPDTSQEQSPYIMRTWLVQPQDLIAETCKRSPRSCAEKTGLEVKPKQKQPN